MPTGIPMMLVIVHIIDFLVIVHIIDFLNFLDIYTRSFSCHLTKSVTTIAGKIFFSPQNTVAKYSSTPKHLSLVYL